MAANIKTVKLLKNAINFHDVDRVRELLPHISSKIMIRRNYFTFSVLSYVALLGNNTIFKMLLENGIYDYRQNRSFPPASEYIFHELYWNIDYDGNIDNGVLLDRVNMLYEVLHYNLETTSHSLIRLKRCLFVIKKNKSNVNYMIEIAYLVLYGLKKLDEFFKVPACNDAKKLLTNYEIIARAKNSEISKITKSWIDLKFFYCLQCKNVPLYLLL